jgi:CheY-like chemotaxis protein
VLVLDDEHLVVKVATHLLSALGYSATGFLNPLDAIEAVRADPHAFDIVLTDSNMPALSGLDAARELIGLRPGLLIGLTSGQPPPSEEELAAAGVGGFLAKPFGIRQLSDFLRRLAGE